ncbi:MAG: PAS domain-containing protein [Cyclobacteriaceae bacterium]
MSESERLRVLEEYHILDSTPEKEFDEIVELASAMFNTPISFISLIESERQWFKSIKGLPVAEAERKYAFCNYTMNHPDEVMVVNDATKDERFKSNPYVVENPKIRFYAGTALATEDNLPIGTMCVLDDKPRDFTEEEAKILKIFAKRIMTLLELRKENLRGKRELRLTKFELDQTLDRLIEAQSTARIGSWDWDLKTNDLYWSPEMYKIYDIAPEEVENLFEEWMSKVHPDDSELVRKTLLEGVKNGKDAILEYRITTKSGNEIWLETIGNVKTDKGKVARMSGTVQEVTRRKEAELKKVIYTETLEGMMFDLSHKIRQPLTNSLGLVEAFNSHNLSESTVREFVDYLKVSVKKMDGYIREMSNYIYNSQEEMNE